MRKESWERFWLTGKSPRESKVEIKKEAVEVCGGGSKSNGKKSIIEGASDFIGCDHH